MGSYSELYISDYPILSAKNDFYEEIASLLFLKEDYIKEKRLYKNRSTVTWGNSIVNEKGNFIFKGFRQKVKFCKQRLEIVGYNISQSKKEFNRSIREIRNSPYSPDFLEGNLTFEIYFSEVREIIVKKLKKENYEYNTLKGYLMSNDLSFGYQFGLDVIYTVMCAVDEESWVEYDLTEIINGGHIYNKVDELIKTEKIIIMTEGKTDTEFIQKSLEVLYPHLYGYYHFMDFPLYDLEGGSSYLLKIIKTFVAANISNRIIALFDNDASAANELTLLKNISIPINFKILQYPKIKLASKYPTVGPSGRKTMNVNGLAGSIEMYLGEDILKENNKLIPVYWKGYQEKSKKYQGEIDKKKEIQNKFRDKLKKFNADKINEKEWENMKSILNLIFNAFA